MIFYKLKRKFDRKVVAKMERLETLSRQTSAAVTGANHTQQVTMYGFHSTDQRSFFTGFQRVRRNNVEDTSERMRPH